MATLLLLLTLFSIRERFNDPDMWWHLKTGEIIWNTHHVPRVDSFSFSTNHHAYIPHEWLSQITIYAAYYLGGYTGLMVWFCAVSFLLISAAYLLCAAYSGNVKIAFLGAMTVWLFSTVGLSIRPQMLGYLLLLAELLILHCGRSRDSRWFFALPLLFAVWVNCHGSFFFGLIVLATVLLCSFIEMHAGLLVAHRWDTQARRRLILASLLSIACLFLNPVGIEQVLYPLNLIVKQHTNTTELSEWKPPVFDSMRGSALLAIAGLICLLPLLRRIELRIEELMLVVFGFELAVLHSRMLFVFGILAAPVLSRLLATAWDKYESSRDRPLLNATLIAGSLGLAVLAFPSRVELNRQVERGNPVKAVNFINESGLSGNMLNEYVYGGYLIWAAPKQKVFIDGRTDIFDWTGILQEYGRWATLQADSRGLLEKHRINFCLLSRSAPMSQVLPLLPGWKRIYEDEIATIFARSNALTR